MTETRSLLDRLNALAARYEAMAVGAAKGGGSAQDAGNRRRDAATLAEAAAALSGLKPSRFRQSWPYAVVFPDNAATPGGHNVRQPDGAVVFAGPVAMAIAQQACDALNQTWDDASD
jgi:hypothetical protein